MLWQLHQLVLGTHIFVAMLWVGGVMFIGWGLFPAIRKWSYSEQRKIFATVMAWAHWPLTLAGCFVIATGILLGTVLGPINQWADIFQTRYGLTWLTALLIGLFTLAWGVFIGNQMAKKLFSQTDIWKNADHGDKKPLANKLVLITAVESVEIVGFITLIYFMISF